MANDLDREVRVNDTGHDLPQVSEESVFAQLEGRAQVSRASPVPQPHAGREPASVLASVVRRQASAFNRVALRSERGMLGARSRVRQKRRNDLRRR